MLRVEQLFSSYCILLAYTQDPNSFPTRRSSDLADHGPDVVGDDGLGVHHGGLELEDPHAGLEQLLVVAPPCQLRSEEHTSELQSRRDLVCRLLLEKKKYPVWTLWPGGPPPSPCH